MRVIDLIRVLTGHSQSANKDVHILLDGVDIGPVSELVSEDGENFYLEVKK